MSKPSEWAMKQARSIYRELCDDTNDQRPDDMEDMMIADVARILDAAELRGHTRAVNETAIHSVHKAVAAERAAVVKWLRRRADGVWHGSAETAVNAEANAIEQGEHHPDGATPTPSASS